MAEQTDLEKCNFRNFRSSVTLTLDRVIWHTVVHQSSTSIYTPNFTEIGKTFCGRTDGRTYWRTFQAPFNVIRSTRRSQPKNWIMNNQQHTECQHNLTGFNYYLLDCSETRSYLIQRLSRASQPRGISHRGNFRVSGGTGTTDWHKQTGGILIFYQIYLK